MNNPILALVTYIQARAHSQEDGAVAVEYILLIVSVAIVMAVGAATLGGKISGKLGGILP